MTVPPSLPALPVHQERQLATLLASASTAHKTHRQQLRRRGTLAPSDHSATATCNRLTAILIPHTHTHAHTVHHCHENTRSHYTLNPHTDTPKTCLTGALPNITHTTSTLHMLPHTHCHIYTFNNTQTQNLGIISFVSNAKDRED